jgi:ABC-2 type transport system ATP-binding protein
MIIANNLTKSFKSYKKQPGFVGSVKSMFSRDYTIKTAVKSFNMEIPKGEIIGLLGPNGAGKTTLMKMFTGIIVPSDGELSIAGHSPSQREKEFRKKIALVMGQKSQLWWDIPAMDSFLLLQKYYELSESQFKSRIDQMTELLGVGDLLHVHIRKLSLGERMKMELMASLLHNPEVIFLDEPTIGLDLVAQENIRNFIKDYHAKNNCTIVLTSHYMADVQELCSRLVLILAGEKAYDGPITEFETILGHEKIASFQFGDQINTSDELWQNYSAEWSENNTKVELKIPEAELRQAALKILSDYPVTEFQTEKMPIERVMKTLMENPKILTCGQAN